jgi:hypothetical protein
MFETDFYQCTCSAEFTNEENAIRHVYVYHTNDEQQRNVELFKDRVRVMISSLNSQLSFDRV